MKCKKCKIKMDKTMLFCPKCGNKVEKKNLIKSVVLLGLGFSCLLLFFLALPKKEKKLEAENTPILEDIVYNYTKEGIPKFISGPFSEQNVKNSQDALMALNAVKEMFQFQNVEEEFFLVSEEVSENRTYYRFNQKFNEIPVYNQDIILAVENEKIKSFSGYYIPNIDLDTKPKYKKEEIEETIKNVLNTEVNFLKNELMIWARKEKNTLIYTVELLTNENAYEFIVDANTKEILSQIDKMDEANTFQYTGMGMDGMTYTINLEEYYDVLAFKNRYRFFDRERNISIANYDRTGYIVGLLVSAIPGTTPMEVEIENEKIQVYLPRNREIVNSAITAMAHYEKIYDYYLNVLGRNSFDNKGSKIIVNLGITNKTFTNEDLNNAMWCHLTNQMYIGNYKGKSFAASLDVLAHELTHGVISFISKFAGSPKEKNEAFETGALNEAYADIIGSLIEGENWTIAENNETLRNLENPAQFNYPSVKGGEFYYPDNFSKNGLTLEEFLNIKGYEHVSDYDKGGVHINSNVVGHAAYLMYKKGAFESREEMAKVWYNSLFLLSSYSNFEDCALAVIETAKNLGLSESSIYKIKEAFYETKMLDVKELILNGKVLDNEKGIRNAKIEIYPLKTKELKGTFYSKEEGNYEINLYPGEYEIKVTKVGYEDYKEIVKIEDSKEMDIHLISQAIKESIYSCKSGDCVTLTLYYLDEGENGKLVEKIITERVDRGTILGAKYLVEAANIGLGAHLESDGKTFTFELNGIKTDLAWYYRGTKEKFDWNQPITKDVTIEMKIFNGILDNGSFMDANANEIDINNILDATDYFSQWFK